MGATTNVPAAPLQTGKASSGVWAPYARQRATSRAYFSTLSVGWRSWGGIHKS